MKYTVKTRNWNGKKSTAFALNCIAAVTGTGAYKTDDLDNKYLLLTPHTILAWSTWLLFMALRRWSGGWTYIVRAGHGLGSGYKSIY
jgi:hypothetical protein